MTDPEELTAPGLSSNPTHSQETPPPAIPLLSDLPFEATPSMGHPFVESLAGHSQQKWGCSPSGSFGDNHEKTTWIDSPEMEVRSEHSSTWGIDYTPKLILGTRPSSA